MDFDTSRAAKSLAEVAATLGLPVSTVKKLERRALLAFRAEIEARAEALGVSPRDYLVDDEVPIRPEQADTLPS